MIRKCKIIIVTMFIILFCGCSCNKEALINENLKLIEENQKIETEKQGYEGLKELFMWYNNITTRNVNSFVLVESKNTFGNTCYSDGIVIGNIGLDYYILTDYTNLSQSGGVSYRVMDANASVYKGQIMETDKGRVYDSKTGLVIIKVNVNSYTNLVMKSISMGERSETIAHISSIEQINKIQVLDDIKTSTTTYNDTSYEYYKFDENIDDGALLNLNNELCAFYSSSINGFVSVSLIKEVVYSIYSLVL